MIKTSITLQELRRKIYIKVKAMISDKPDVKLLGKRSALNAHAAFDEADAGNTVEKIGAPVFDPTCERLGGETPSCLLSGKICVLSPL